MKTKVYKVELLIVNHDKLTENEIADAIEYTKYPNRCIMPSVMKMEVREVDWSDEHPLNNLDKQEEEYKKLFSTVA